MCLRIVRIFSKRWLHELTMVRQSLLEEKDLIEDLYSLFASVIETQTDLVILNSKSWIRNFTATEMDIVVPEWDENPELDSPLIGVDIGIRGYKSDPKILFQTNLVRNKVLS